MIKINAVSVFENKPVEVQRVFAVCNCTYRNGEFFDPSGNSLHPRYWIPMFDEKLDHVVTEGWDGTNPGTD